MAARKSRQKRKEKEEVSRKAITSYEVQFRAFEKEIARLRKEVALLQGKEDHAQAEHGPDAVPDSSDNAACSSAKRSRSESSSKDSSGVDEDSGNPVQEVKRRRRDPLPSSSLEICHEHDSLDDISRRMEGGCQTETFTANRHLDHDLYREVVHLRGIVRRIEEVIRGFCGEYPPSDGNTASVPSVYLEHFNEVLRSIGEIYEGHSQRISPPAANNATTEM
jgi:hypothetical protein